MIRREKSFFISFLIIYQPSVKSKIVITKIEQNHCDISYNSHRAAILFIKSYGKLVIMFMPFLP